MNKSSLKTFATWGRNELREKVKIKLEILGIEEDKINKGDTYGNLVSINGFEYSKHQYNQLITRYNEIGYTELIEEVAYIWFNRLTALAYMEKNGYINDGLIYSTTSKREPDILDNYMEVEFFDKLSQDKKNVIYDLKDSHKLEEMYFILIEEKCLELSSIMPFMFEKKVSYTDLLFPSGLLLEDSFLIRLREEMNNAVDEGEGIVPVELLGWLYQFYNFERREVVYDGSMKKAKIEKEYIAPATQLFTPHWIVEYIVENTLGRLALERLGVSENLKKKWKYYIEPKEGLDYSIKGKIEELKLIDPAMGSGHILTYSFDVLFDIYEDLGWSSKEAVLSILKNNIYGLEIDDRAGMLASFAILMKGREKYKRLFKVILKADETVVPNTITLKESNTISEQLKEIISKNNLKNIEKLLENFLDAKEYGSILKLEELKIEEVKNEIEKLNRLVNSKEQLNLLLGNANFKEGFTLIKDLLKQYEVMNFKYDITVENPPYMGNSRMNSKLKNYINSHYKTVKSDLFSVFFIKSCEMTKKDGYLGFMSPFVWMFIKSYEDLRKEFLDNKTITSLIQLEYSGFTDATVPICTFTLQNKLTAKKGEYIKLSEFKGPKNQPIKTLEAIKNSDCGWRFSTYQKDFEKIPGSPIAYWVSKKIINSFKIKKSLEDRFEMTGSHNKTANNNKYLRFRWEVNSRAVKDKWVEYTKGGEYRKWYGNKDYVVDWSKTAIRFYEKNSTSNLINKKFWFKKGITYTELTSKDFSSRYISDSAISDMSGPAIYTNTLGDIYYSMAFLNSKIASNFLKLLNPTMHVKMNDLKRLPIINIESKEIKSIAQNSIELSKQEWNSRETSGDFEKNPLIEPSVTLIEEAVKSYENIWKNKFFKLHSNEEKLNKNYIEIYELQDEMDEKVKLEDITLLKKEAILKEFDSNSIDLTTLNKAEIEQGKKVVFNRTELVKQFLSYTVGCIMGRYSIDKKGLIIANSDDELIVENNTILIKGSEGIRHEIKEAKFIPDKFGIIPITGERVFDNDIVTKIEEFIGAAYGSETLTENLEFIATHLGIKTGESPRECIRRYFIKDFYKDHLQRYKKRPIYWMVNSGNKEGFSALIYIHRYRENTIGRIRADYLTKYQEVMETILSSNNRRLEDDDLKAKDKKVIEKEIKTINTQLAELKKFALVVKDIADQKISIDLDDGVKVNYAKFGKVLKKI